MSPSTTAITASLPVEKQGVVSALNHTAREMGAALGIALVGSILNAQYRANISDAAAALPPELAQPVRAGIGGAGEAIRWCPARDRSSSATMGATSPSSNLAARASTWCCSIPTGSARAGSIPSSVAAVFAPVLPLSCVGGRLAPRQRRSCDWTFHLDSVSRIMVAIDCRHSRTSGRAAP